MNTNETFYVIAPVDLYIVTDAVTGAVTVRTEKREEKESQK